MKDLLNKAVDDSLQMLPKLRQMDQTLQRLGEAMLACWTKRRQVLVAGNGGSTAYADAPGGRALCAAL